MSFKGTEGLVQRVQALARQNVPELIHAELLQQLRRKRAQIPRATGALERSLLDGSDDTMTAHRVTIEGLPQLDARRAADVVAREMMRRSGLSGGF